MTAFDELRADEFAEDMYDQERIDLQGLIEVKAGIETFDTFNAWYKYFFEDNYENIQWRNNEITARPSSRSRDEL